jgi:hypothetical protein
MPPREILAAEVGTVGENVVQVILPKRRLPRHLDELTGLGLAQSPLRCGRSGMFDVTQQLVGSRQI